MILKQNARKATWTVLQTFNSDFKSFLNTRDLVQGQSLSVFDTVSDGWRIPVETVPTGIGLKTRYPSSNTVIMSEVWDFSTAQPENIIHQIKTSLKPFPIKIEVA